MFPLSLFMKTTLAKNVQLKDKTWYVVDAKDQVLGRVAVKIANILRGRHKPTYTPHVDTGDYVIVINADKNRLANAMLLKLRVYAGDKHDHAASNPIPFKG